MSDVAVTHMEIIKLNVGGIKFSTTKSTLLQFGFFRGLLSGNFLQNQDDGCYFVDRDGKMFEYLLNYARCGYVSIPAKYISIIDMEAKFYQIHLNLKKFLEKKKLPQLLLRGYLHTVGVNDKMLTEPDVYKSYGLDKDSLKKYNRIDAFVAYLTENFHYDIALRSSQWINDPSQWGSSKNHIEN
eukprot:346827_1